MCKDQKFYQCKHCGNLVGMIHASGVPMICCGEKMTLLEPNTTDGAKEKHVPQVSVEGNLVTVNIGSVDHPMVEEHYIQWIYLQTNEGGHRKALEPGMAPKAIFALTEGEKPCTAYEYCNLHGLWAAEIQ